MEPEVSEPCLQKRAIVPLWASWIQSALSHPIYLGLNGLLGFATTFLYAFIISPFHATYLTHLISLDLIAGLSHQPPVILSC